MYMCVNLSIMIKMCLSVSFRAGGYDNKEPANIHLGVVILRKFCLSYESILDDGKFPIKS